MRIRDLLEIQSIVDKRAIPCDIAELDISYYSESKEQDIKILDMHLVHFIRVYLNNLERVSPQHLEIDGILYKQVEKDYGTNTDN
jgi:hypothetical protein